MSNIKQVPISVELLNINQIHYTLKSYKLIEEAGRTCYKSENKNNSIEITESLIKITESFIKGLIKSGHTSVLEHLTVSARIICDRGTSHQLVRHRHIAVSQQSTRYVTSEPLEVIKPLSLDKSSLGYAKWLKSVNDASENYSSLLEIGVGKDIARSTLPICTKTELVITTNIREWRHIIQQRRSKYAHENAREVARQLLILFYSELPALFEDLKEDQIDE